MGIALLLTSLLLTVFLAACGSEFAHGYASADSAPHANARAGCRIHAHRHAHAHAHARTGA